MQSNNNEKLQIEGNRWLEEHEDRLRSRATTTRNKTANWKKSSRIGSKNTKKDCDAEQQQQKRKLQIERNRHELI